VRIEQDFTVERSPETVFDYLTDPAKLAEWQTVKTEVEQLTEGPPRQGTRFRERNRGPGGREFEQVTEFTEYDRPRHVRVAVVEGPFPVDGSWTFRPAGAGTAVHFVAEGPLPGPMRLLEPLAKRLVKRRFAGYHALLKRNLEASSGT
jgi:carbon monoxide dehydrogenase subunit G